MPDPNVIHHASTAFTAKFKSGMEGFTPDYLKLSTVVQSSSASTGYGFLGEFPMLSEWIGERNVQTLADHDYSVTNKLFQASIKVKRTDFEDNDYGKYSPLFEEMGRNGAEYPDEYIYDLLKKGTTQLCYDGQNFFDTDHQANGETISNLFKPSDQADEKPKFYLLDTTRALKPLIWQERVKPQLESVNANGQNIDDSVFMLDEYKYGVRARGNAGYTLWQLAACSSKGLTEENFAEVYDAMFATKADNGRPLRIRPNLIVVPPAYRQKAMELFQREYLANGESNPNYKIVEVLVSPWLS
ncbi:head protein [Parashewanella curva]|uniref:Head protein n=1 Tax=Parashewanella curva TaxID=2338552 RepID=A0A3L8PT52_9GAMM|nr:Mu-like prophage major head subunit gpT family protein [Parashewanella curva]RLV58607.1 head protein [Parashewanella curva]